MLPTCMLHTERLMVAFDDVVELRRGEDIVFEHRTVHKYKSMLPSG